MNHIELIEAYVSENDINITDVKVDTDLLSTVAGIEVQRSLPPVPNEIFSELTEVGGWDQSHFRRIRSALNQESCPYVFQNSTGSDHYNQAFMICADAWYTESPSRHVSLGYFRDMNTKFGSIASFDVFEGDDIESLIGLCKETEYIVIGVGQGTPHSMDASNFDDWIDSGDDHDGYYSIKFHPSHQGRVAAIIAREFVHMYAAMNIALESMQQYRVDNPGSEEAIPWIQAWDSVKQEAVKIKAEMDSILIEVKKREEEMDSISSRYAAMTRLNFDDRIRAQHMPRNITKLSFQFAKLGSGLEAFLMNDRRIITDTVEFDPSSLIKFTTHDFVMRVQGICENCDYNRENCECEEFDGIDNNYKIPGITYEIDISNGFDWDYFQAYTDESPEGENVHPHVQEGHLCLGDAAMQMGEAWGRRDWESMVSILLAWHCVYNADSPYIGPENMGGYFDETEDVVGWIIPATATPEVVA